MTYQFDTETAQRYGVDEAIMLANIEYWIRKNEANERHYHEGRYWTYNKQEAFTKLFPFWSVKQIRRILKSLQEQGAIITGNYNTDARDRTIWYALGDAYLGNLHLPKRANAADQTGECNIDSIYNNHITITNNKQTDDKHTATGGVSAPPRGTSDSAMCLFANSRFSSWEAFSAQFSGPEFADIDVGYYYHAVADWSAQRGKKMKDWIATARNFMRKDKERGTLHKKASGMGGLAPDAVEYLQYMADYGN